MHTAFLSPRSCPPCSCSPRSCPLLRQASPPYGGYVYFSRPTIRIPTGKLPRLTVGTLVSPVPPFVSQSASLSALRRECVISPGCHSYLPKDVSPATDGKLVSRAPPFVSRPGSFLSLRRVRVYLSAHPSHRDQQASSPYEGYAWFHPPAIRTSPGMGLPTTDGKLASRAPPFVSRPARFSSLRRYP